jgi:hypothetical protein
MASCGGVPRRGTATASRCSSAGHSEAVRSYCARRTGSLDSAEDLRCEALRDRRHRIMHGVSGYDAFGRLMFGFGRRDTAEVIDVPALEALACELHRVGVEWVERA